MSAREIVADVLEHLPDDVTLEEAVRRINFVAGMREGLAELDRGEGIPSRKSRLSCLQGLSSNARALCAP